MQPDAHEALWLDPGERLTMAQLAESCGSTEAYLHELIDYGVLLPANLGELQAAFSVDCLFRVRKASRLRDDLELDIHALALAIRLLDRIESLEAELAALRRLASRRFQERA